MRATGSHDDGGVAILVGGNCVRGPCEVSDGRHHQVQQLRSLLPFAVAVTTCLPCPILEQAFNHYII